MPNYVRNRVVMEGIANLPLFREVDGKKHFDFNKLIPMPEYEYYDEKLRNVKEGI